MEKIKIGIIGLGMGFERLHLPALKRLNDKFEIAAICDLDRKKLDHYQEELSLDVDVCFTDYDEMLKLNCIEAVLTVVPIEENFEANKAAILNKKHLIAEKPFSKDVKGAKKLIKLAKENNVKVLVAENLRYNEEVQIIKKIIDEKKLDNVVYFVDNNVFNFNEDMKNDTFAAREWRQHPTFFGGTFLDGAIHDLAKHRYLFGNVHKLQAFGKKIDDNEHSEFNVINTIMHFDVKNITGHYINFNNGVSNIKPPIGFRIFFENGELYLENKDSGIIELSYNNGKSDKIKYKAGEGYYNEWINFYNALCNNEPIISNMESELSDIELVFDILNSAVKNT